MKYRVKKICINKKSKGITLIELIVAMGIFSVIIVIVVSLFAATLRGYRKSAALQNVQENARFLLDFMTKEIRQSTIISVVGAGGYHGYTLNIKRPDDTEITYIFDGTNIQRLGGGADGAINSQQVMVSGGFFISGTTGGTGADSFQPKVTISLKVQTQATKAEERASIDLQATLSQRILDI
jgi:prepilin-type N-terminal cleavage/methylation domain-containing protein